MKQLNKRLCSIDWEFNPFHPDTLSLEIHLTMVVQGWCHIACLSGLLIHCFCRNSCTFDLLQIPGYLRGKSWPLLHFALWIECCVCVHKVTVHTSNLVLGLPGLCACSHRFGKQCDHTHCKQRANGGSMHKALRMEQLPRNNKTIVKLTRVYQP